MGRKLTRSQLFLQGSRGSSRREWVVPALHCQTRLRTKLTQELQCPRALTYLRFHAMNRVPTSRVDLAKRGLRFRLGGSLCLMRMSVGSTPSGV